MNQPGKADPSIYPKMREHALQIQPPSREPGSVGAILMDWHVGNGTASVLAAFDGTASVYLSSGDGFIGGGQSYPEVREAALRAVRIASGLMAQFEKTDGFDLPARDNVAFFVTTNDGVHKAEASEAELRSGTSSLTALGGTMQMIVTGYRLRQQKSPTGK
jgi:hypothetical protein